MVGASLCRAGWGFRGGAASAGRRRRAPIEYPESQGLSVRRPIEQSAVVIDILTTTDEDERRYALYALSTILGGSTSPCLPQEIREERGLAYLTCSFPGLYHEDDLFGLYTGYPPRSVKDIAEIIGGCLEAIADESITRVELETSYRRAHANRVFGSESVGSWMNQLDQAEIARRPLVSRQETLRYSREVSADDVVAVATEFARTQRSHVTVDPSQ